MSYSVEITRTDVAVPVADSKVDPSSKRVTNEGGVLNENRHKAQGNLGATRCNRGIRQLPQMRQLPCIRSHTGVMVSANRITAVSVCILAGDGKAFIIT